MRVDPEEVAIRPLERRDLDSLVWLMEALTENAESHEAFSVQRFELLFESMHTKPDVYLNLVAEIDGAVVGFVSVVFYSSFFHRVGTALINELVVAREARNRGIGACLIEAVKSAAIERRMDEIEVGTEYGNAGARRFYRSNGFDQEYVLMGVELDSRV